MARTTTVAGLCVSWLFAGSAAAQTVVLSQPGTQVTDTTIRSGSFSNTNFDGQVLITRASNDPEWVRRPLLKFDTKNTIPQGSHIASATLTLTVKSGLGAAGQTRNVQAYRIDQPFQEADATWYVRQYAERWNAAGGDMAEASGAANVSNVPGTKVNFDLTALVQRSVDGEFDSRYTRVELMDTGADAKESYREYYPSEDPLGTNRPVLTIVVGSSAPATPPPTGTTGTLKVMQWNIAQGRGTDGQPNLDRVVSWIVQLKPDLVSLNEVLHYASAASDQPKILCDKLKAATGQTWSFNFEQISGAASGIGVAVLSRFPIEGAASHLLSYDRSAALIRVTVNGRGIYMTSTHLDHQYSSKRLQQVKELKAWEAGFAEQKIVAGDFNWYPGTTEINEMAKDYYDGWAVAKSKGTAVSAASNPDGATRNNRIDYVWLSKGSILTITGAQVYETGTVSDHRPVMVTFKVN